MAIYRGTGSASTTTDQATIDEVTTQATNAASSATSAASSATSAASSATSASSSASTATTKASEASTSATNAATSATSASTSASNAATSATSASTSATAASSSATSAATAQTNAETAQSAAEDAETAAEAARDLAEGYKDLAETYRDEALEAYDDFDDRYLGAKTSDPTVDNDGDALIDGALYFDTTNAQMKVYDLSGTSWEAFSLTAAQLDDVDTVATNIADVQSVADNMSDVQAAQTSATNAATSATNAETSATNASTSATNAASSATAAAASAAAAATSFDDFDDKYLGAKSSAPTTDNDGDALVTGALYYDTTEGSMFVYEGSSWIKASASITDTWDEYVFTATSGQTAFTGSDDNANTLTTSDYMIVTRNGIRLTLDEGYTVTTGTVTLTTGASTGDIITITAFASLQVADTLSLSQGGTVTGAVTFSGNVDGIAFSEIDSTPTTLSGYGITDAATSTQGTLADSAVQPSDNISTLTNDSGYITDYTVTEADVTAHQAALSITESQISDLSHTTSLPFSSITSTPTTISGYGITDAFDGAYSSLTGTPTTLSGYGITDAAALAGANFTGAVDVDATLTANTLALDNGSNDWTFEVSSNKLIIKYGGTAKMELDTSGNLKVTGNVTAYGTI